MLASDSKRAREGQLRRTAAHGMRSDRAQNTADSTGDEKGPRGDTNRSSLAPRTRANPGWPMISSSPTTRLAPRHRPAAHGTRPEPRQRAATEYARCRGTHKQNARKAHGKIDGRLVECVEVACVGHVQRRFRPNERAIQRTSSLCLETASETCAWRPRSSASSGRARPKTHSGRSSPTAGWIMPRAVERSSASVEGDLARPPRPPRPRPPRPPGR